MLNKQSLKVQEALDQVKDENVQLKLRVSELEEELLEERQ